MSLLSRDEARALLERVLSFSSADHCSVSVNGGDNGNIRYARNSVTTSGATQNMSVVVQSTFGRKTGTSTINELDDESLARVVARAEELARLAPENPEFMPPLGPQSYVDSQQYFESTADITPARRADMAAASIMPSRESDTVAAGYISNGRGFSAQLNTAGLFRYQRNTGVQMSVTVRTPDGLGSGWASQDFNDSRHMDSGSTTLTAIEKAQLSRDARAIEPGRYTVILEPAASSGLLGNMVFSMGARTADEGRSFLSREGGGTKLGEKIVDENVTIYSDHTNPEVPANPWDGSGRPRERTYWIREGVVENMTYSRYWAREKGVGEGTPFPGNYIIEGGTASLDDLIADTRRGILVTRTWYIRTVDPQTLLYTGLTRDGTFFVENGRIQYAVKNFRFNESPIIMLNNLEAMGRPQRINGNLIPPMKVRDFSFTSLSDAV